ncbi:MAG: DUF1588 domain-containing protein [Myxococcota bacterium]
MNRGWLALIALIGCTGQLIEPGVGVDSEPEAQRSPDPIEDVSQPFACVEGSVEASPPRIWRLNGEQHVSALADLNIDVPLRESPFTGVQGGELFSNQAEAFGMPESTVEALFSRVGLWADDAATRIGDREPCTQELDRSCIESLLQSLLPQAFRRPVSTEELRRYADLADQGREELGAEAGLGLLLEAILVSPDFLFRWEVGRGDQEEDRRRLDGYELASALSFTLADSPPDAELLDRAESGTLDEPSEIDAQVRRLLGSLGEHGPSHRFFEEYFDYSRASEVFKDPDEFTAHDAGALVESNRRFLAEAMESEDFLSTLFTSSQVAVSPDTAETYGVASPSEWELVEVAERSGVLTQPAFLVSWSEFDHNDPIRRGKLIRERLLCERVPDLPIGGVPDLPDDPALTLRERLAIHRADPACAACHDLMDPLGLGLEGFDHFGRFRIEEAGRPVETSGEIEGSDIDGGFADHHELAARLASSNGVRRCFVLHAFQYWAGRRESEADACSLAAAERRFVESGGNLAELWIGLFQSEAFLYRRSP